MSASEGNNHVSKIPVEVTLVGRASPWEMKSRLQALGWRPELELSGIMCGTALIFIFCRDHSQRLIYEATVVVSGPPLSPNCAYFLWTSF